MSKQKVIICQDLKNDLTAAIQACPHDKLFILVDEHTKDLCLPLIAPFACLANANIITIGAEDIHKNVETLVHVWTELGNGGGTRHSLMINLGGGMVTDLGGFAASTFKRGIQYINIPTTLLGMVDASVGGKTGINFNGLKNEIGVFSPAEYVLIDTEFLKSLDSRNLLSGYAEMLKHGIISTTAHWAELLNFDMNHIDYKALQALVAKSVHIRHVLHGYAVAWGIVCELYYSYRKVGFPKDKLQQTIRFIKENYGIFPFDCKQYDRLYEFMTHDKKNSAGIINFTLMGEIGDIRINQSANKEEILDMLDFYRETMGC